jgi:signal transduction histidine kinase
LPLRETLHDLRNLHALIVAAAEQGERQAKAGQITAAVDKFSQIRALIEKWIARRLKQDDPGHGLGLEIVKNSVEKLGGTFFLDPNFGAGATATVFLPARRMAEIEGHETFFNLNSTVQMFSLQVRDFLTVHEINFEVRLNEEPNIWIVGDELDMMQILLNLCFNSSNAIAAAKTLPNRVTSGNIMIVVGIGAGQARLGVIDNGIGFPKAP